MKQFDSEVLNKLYKGFFPNEKNRVWTMCQATLKMATRCIEEAEKFNLTNEQFFLNFEDCLNLLSVKDHNNKIKDIDTFNKNLEGFYKDQK